MSARTALRKQVRALAKKAMEIKGDANIELEKKFIPYCERVIKAHGRKR
jgi:hypothetical protein